MLLEARTGILTVFLFLISARTDKQIPNPGKNSCEHKTSDILKDSISAHLTAQYRTYRLHSSQKGRGVDQWLVSRLASDGRETNGREYKVESQALLDTCLADVFVVSTKERFVRPLGSLNGAERSPG